MARHIHIHVRHRHAGKTLDVLNAKEEEKRQALAAEIDKLSKEIEKKDDQGVTVMPDMRKRLEKLQNEFTHLTVKRSRP